MFAYFAILYLEIQIYSLQGDDWMDMDDPNVVAEQELLAAAAAIDAAAGKLAALQPKARP